MGVSVYVLSIAVLLVGIYGVVAKKNVVKIIVGVLLLDYAVNLFLVLVGYRSGGTAPILGEGETGAELAARAVDPLPQAMVLTSIVIGLGLTALMVAIAIRLYEKYGTFDADEMRKLRG
ncbi:MAG: NADH-quinone oxidoreductase subunit K [Planctomycetota bacterium]